MMDRVIQTQQALGKLLGRSKKAWSVRDTDLTNIAATTEIIRDDRTEETEISERLKNNNIKSIAEKEIAFQKARDAHKEAIRKQTTSENYIGTIEKEKATKISAQSELMRKSQIASRHLKRKDLALMLTNRLKNRLVDEELFARVEIKKKIDAIIERFMRKPFNVRIDENYRLKVINEKGDEIPKSTGENQMLGLAFTGAIASFAKERRYEESDILLSGTEAPLVVDSPFGHLDPLYRKGVANFLPNLASQVILLVSTSQASKEVLDELDGKIGTQYVLSRYNQFPQGNKESENLTINGKTIDLTKYDQQFTGTKIEEVTQ
jgi:DNA sulfur modification protein DndD